MSELNHNKEINILPQVDPGNAVTANYNFKQIEKKWQKQWEATEIYKVPDISPKPKCYVLDMFPYPSGTGLHVGHPLGYIASDIYARYKRLKGFNVLHPMGYDSFGLPAEQYALETGQHPAVTTQKNIDTFRAQLDNIGFCFDWSREIRTSDPKYYQWTQWIFLQIFNSWYDQDQGKARRIEELVKIFQLGGSLSANAAHSTGNSFSHADWENYDEAKKMEILMNYRLAYSAYGDVNWCEALGTVLANDEVINGVSERGGHLVVKKKMRQWYLRITGYAERLLQGLNTVDFSDAMKEMQKNWIGKSEGAEVAFNLQHSPHSIQVYTTRPDTIFGVDFMVLAPEHELVNEITTSGQKEFIERYLDYVKRRSERERVAEVKSITGAFTGAYAINPFDGNKIPIWISEYVLSGYGTGAIMAVPCGDQRDFSFAQHFNIPITNIIGEYFNGREANPTKDAILTNSGFLDGMVMKDAIPVVLQKIEDMGIGKRKVNYKMRDAGFSRQRYWGEPFPIVYRNGTGYAVNESELPVELPHVEIYRPGPEGEGPLANISEWVYLTPGPSPGERGETLEERKKGHYMTTDPDAWRILKTFARENRREKTPAEDVLWQHIRNRKISDCKFRRQHAIGPYIVDFVCIEKKLIIEVDGGYHADEEQEKYDIARTEYLNESGFTEIRFSNEEVTKTISQTLQKIEKSLAQVPPLPRGGVRGEVKRETNTMPGYAGSSWYFLRYMDPHNDKVFADKKVTGYWNQVDVYVGGTEHAVGHLLYSRLWTKILFDLGYISFDEPFRKLVNQGMIQGSSRFVYRMNSGFRLLGNILNDYFAEYNFIEESSADRNWNFDFTSNTKKINFQILYQEFIGDGFKETSEYFLSDYKYIFITHEEIFRFYSLGLNVLVARIDELLTLRSNYSSDIIPITSYFISSDRLKEIGPIDNGIQVHPIHVDVNIVDGVELDIREFKKWKNGEFANAEFILSSDKYICGVEVEKMSKSKYNTVNPNEIIDKYGADTFRMYEMFLGPVEQSKPWDTKGIEGIHRFLKKLWRLFYDDLKGKTWTLGTPSDNELKVLHKTIKKIEEDTERFSYNTAVSAFMICVNELTDVKCFKISILRPLLILMAPYAPHITEELWQLTGNTGSIIDSLFPVFESKYLVETSKEYPISINGKLRTTISIAVDASPEQVEQIVLSNDVVKKWLDSKSPKKIIYVKNKMVNVVI